MAERPGGSTGTAARGAPEVPPLLAVSGLTKRYGAATVVRDVGFDLAPGEFVCILGPSGCGKTTLLRLIAGFERADAGSIRQGGADVTAMPPEARDFGIVFQSYALFPNRTVFANVGFGLESVGVTRAERRTRVMALLAMVGLSDHAEKYPSQLSGGQQQRVALARALALQPGLLLLDEPLSALDSNVRAHLRDELRALQRRLGVSTLMVTHDQSEALSIADRIIVMNAGRVQQIGTPTALYTRPASLFVARFLGEINAFPIEAMDGGAMRIAGARLLVADAPATLPPSAQLCIRPAAVAVGDEAASRENRLVSRVVSATFFGDAVRLALAPEGGEGPLVLADLPFARLGRIPHAGEIMQVALPAAQLMVLPGHA